MLQKIDCIAICVLDLNKTPEFFKKLGFEEVNWIVHPSRRSRPVAAAGGRSDPVRTHQAAGDGVPAFNHVAFRVENCAVETAEL